MAGIPDHVIDEVRSRADIVEVVGGYVSLKQAGHNHRGLCPFHEEKSPSFNVNDTRQIFHCFGCGEGGNVFTFLMKHQSMSFPESVRTLAERYGVEIPESSTDRKKSEQFERYYATLEAATRFYEERLATAPDSSLISRYLAERSIEPDSVKDFRLGYAPDDWDQLCRHMTKGGFGDKDLEAVGLAQQSKRGTYIDRFRGRLIFPIRSLTGKVLGFGARTIAPDDTSAKYLNSPETPVYHKSQVLYGAYEARESARKEETVIVVEGYMDTLALRKAGFPNAVAASGTAFTPQQAKIIGRLCRKVILLFDSDSAGKKAAHRCATILMAEKMEVKTLLLPDTKDPDEFLQKKGADQLRELLENAPAHLRFVIDSIAAQHDLTDVEGMIAATKKGIAFLKTASDPLERESYAKYLASVTRADVGLILRELGREGERKPGDFPVATAAKRTARKKKGSSRAEKILIGVLMAHPDYLDSVAEGLTPDDFTDETYRAMFLLVQEGAARGVTAVGDIISGAETDDIRRDLSALVSDRALFDEERAEQAARDCLQSIRRKPVLERQALLAMLDPAQSGSGNEFEVAQKKYFALRSKRLK